LPANNPPDSDLESGESGDTDAVGGQDLLDRGLLVLHERLLGQHDVLEVGVHPAVHDLRYRLLRLALVPRDLLGDPALLLHHVCGDVLADHVERAHRGDLLGEVAGDLGVLLIQLDHDADGRRQRGVGAVQVTGHVSTLEAGEPAELELLLQRRTRRLDELLDRGARLGLGGQQRRLVVNPGV
jgi:hypothetical protein